MKGNVKYSNSYNSKKVGALLALVLLWGVVKIGAEEVVATILFGPEKLYDAHGYSYAIDSTGDSIVDRHLRATMSDSVDPVFETLTKYYLKPGVKFIFEDKGLNPFDDIGLGHIIAIKINEDMVELTRLFPRSIINERLSRLRDKLIREGR